MNHQKRFGAIQNFYLLKTIFVAQYLLYNMLFYYAKFSSKRFSKVNILQPMHNVRFLQIAKKQTNLVIKYFLPTNIGGMNQEKIPLNNYSAGNNEPVTWIKELFTIL